MSAFRDLMSIVDPAAAKTSTAPKQAAPAGGSKPVARPAGGPNGASQAPQLKRKASGPVDNSHVKIQRMGSASQPSQPNGVSRLPPTPTAAKPKSLAPSSTVPYRGTAAPASAKSASPVVRKPVAPTTTSSIAPKVTASTPRLAPATTAPSASSAAAPKKGYLALLQKAKEKDTTKPVPPPGKQEPGKILTRKERLALKAEASAVSKGKKPLTGPPGRSVDAKGDPSKEKRKPAEMGYQGTARPAKKPAEVGYKGTARSATAPASSSRGGTPSTKAKPNPAKGRYDGYADWDDLDDMEDDEEEDYASDASSDMEGGLWDVEEEENLALKVAKKEDAEALAEEMALKKEKEERKRKLLALSKANAAKRKY